MKEYLDTFLWCRRTGNWLPEVIGPLFRSLTNREQWDAIRILYPLREVA